MAGRPEVLFIIGGARSGKSRHALTLAEAWPGPGLFIATAAASDEEMAARIARHREERGPRWRTVEAATDLPSALRVMPPEVTVCVVDCLTLWLSNLLISDADLPAAARGLVAALDEVVVPTILVSNEVGQGIVPDNALARRFRDEAGRLHQAVAARADRVVLMTAGLPLDLKPRPGD